MPRKCMFKPKAHQWLDACRSMQWQIGIVVNQDVIDKPFRGSSARFCVTLTEALRNYIPHTIHKGKIPVQYTLDIFTVSTPTHLTFKNNRISNNGTWLFWSNEDELVFTVNGGLIRLGITKKHRYVNELTRPLWKSPCNLCLLSTPTLFFWTITWKGLLQRWATIKHFVRQ